GVGGSAAHHLARPGALRLRGRVAGGAPRLTAPLQLWVVDARTEVRSWLSGRLAEAGHGVAWAGAPDEVEQKAGAPEILVIGVPDDSAGLESFRGAVPDVPVVAWVEPGRPVPQLTPPFEWASSSDGGALLGAVERSVPWVNLRRERDASRA